MKKTLVIMVLVFLTGMMAQAQNQTGKQQRTREKALKREARIRKSTVNEKSAYTPETQLEEVPGWSKGDLAKLKKQESIARQEDALDNESYEYMKEEEAARAARKARKKAGKKN